MVTLKTLLHAGLLALWLLGTATGMILAQGQAGEAQQEESERIYSQGLLSYLDGDLEKALESFLAALREDPENFQAAYLAGSAYGKLGRYSEALPLLQRAVPLDPAYPEARLALAVTFYHLERFSEALESARRAIELDPDSGLAYYYQGLVLFRQENFSEARASFQTSAQLDNSVAALGRHYSGLCHLAEGDRSSAARSFFEAALAYQTDSKLAEARTALELASDLDPDASFAPQARERLAQITAQVQQEEGKGWSLRLGIGFEGDSNVILQPEGGPALGQITDKEDSRFVFTGSGTLDLISGEDGKLTAGYDFFQSLHTDVSEFNVQVHVGRLIGTWRANPRLRIGLEGGVAHYMLGQKSYLQEPYLTPFAGFFSTDRNYTRASFTFSDRNFRVDYFDPLRDGSRYEIDLRHYVLIKEFQTYLFGGYGFADENPDDAQGNDFHYRSHQVGGGARVAFSSKLSADAGYWFRADDYDFPNSRSGFTIPREDRVHQISLSFRRALAPKLDLRVGYLGTVNNSNIAVFDYNRHVVSGGVEIVF